MTGNERHLLLLLTERALASLERRKQSLPDINDRLDISNAQADLRDLARLVGNEAGKEAP